MRFSQLPRCWVGATRITHGLKEVSQLGDSHQTLDALLVLSQSVNQHSSYHLHMNYNI
jgi:hypothetical protein